MQQIYDVVVCGGGLAGVCAALAAAENGAKTLLIERNAFPGGNATAALVSPFMGFTHEPEMSRDEYGFKVYGWQKYLNSGIFPRIIDRLRGEGGMSKLSTPFSADPEILKYVLESMLVEAGVELLYAAQVCGVEKTAAGSLFTIEAVECLCKEGLRQFAGRRFIDATGDADLTSCAGGSFLMGDENGTTQAATLMFLIDNVDEAQVTTYRQAHPEEFEDSDYGTVSGFTSQIATAAGRGELPEHIRRFVLFRLPEQGRYAANITHYYEINATVSESVTKAAIELRAQMMQVFRVMRRDLPGFANAYISASGSYPGIRESRRIAGVTYFTVDMLRECPVPEKYLALCSYPVDLHMKNAPANNMHTMGLFGIPEGTCIHREFTNLYAAGRNLSTDRLVHSAIRVMGVVASIGESVGRLCLRK